jgi:hypothetical protein
VLTVFGWRARDGDCVPDETEVTPEMVEAGLRVLYGELGGSLPPTVEREALVTSVFLAMDKNRLKAPGSFDVQSHAK